MGGCPLLLVLRPFALGNLTQILERHAWPFLDDLGTGYGKVVRLTDLFGVRTLPLVSRAVETYTEHKWIFTTPASSVVRLRSKGFAPDCSQRNGHLRIT